MMEYIVLYIAFNMYKLEFRVSTCGIFQNKKNVQNYSNNNITK